MLYSDLLQESLASRNALLERFLSMQQVSSGPPSYIEDRL